MTIISFIMEHLLLLVDFVLHLDVHLNTMVITFGPWVYAIVFAIVFAETGLIVTPFLPGDSLLFTLGALASIEGSPLNPWALIATLTVAANLGDIVNYSVGSYVGPKVFASESSRFFKKDYLVRTQNFYQKYGTFTIVMARFVPIIRTFAPFVAGIGRMTFKKYIGYSVAGALTWTLLFIQAGYYFGNLPVVKRNFHIVIFGVIFVSILPLVFSYLKARSEKATYLPS